jgi:iron complex outermembrane receptor protein
MVVDRGRVAIELVAKWRLAEGWLSGTEPEMAAHFSGAAPVLLALGLSASLFTTSEAQELAQAPEAPIRLPPVTISAPARLPGAPLPDGSVPATVQTITGEEIRRSGAVTLQDYLKRLPGVTLNDEQGNAFQPGVQLRGFQVSPVTGVPQGVSVFVDGVRVNEPTVDEVNFDLIPLDDVERIELIRGPSAVFGRNTLGGSLNIVTRRGSGAPEIVTSAEGGSFDRQKYRASLGGAGGPIDYYVSGSLLREEGWRERGAAKLDKAFGKLGYRGGDTDVWLSFQYANDRIEQPGSLPPDDVRAHRARNFTAGDFWAPRLYLGTLEGRQAFGDETTLVVNAFARKLDAEQFNASLIADNTRAFTDTLSFGGTVQLNWEPTVFGSRHHVAAGVEYAQHRVTSTVFEEKNARTLPACVDEAMADGEDVASACPLKRLSTQVRDRQHAVGIYLQDTWEVARGLLRSADGLVLTGALRWDWLRHDIVDESPPESDRPSATGVSTFSRLNPRIGVNYNLSRDTGLFFSYGEGFRAPAFLELTCAGPGAICPGLQAGVAPDPPLKAVKARSYEVGVRSRPLPWLEGQLSLFRTDVIDDIFAVSPTGTTGVFFQNVGNTRREGLELSARATFRAVEAFLGYTYTRATFRDPVELATPRQTPGCVGSSCTQLVRAGNDLPLVPRHRLNAGVDYRPLPWLTLSITGAYVGAQRFRGDEANVADPLDAYFVMNAGLRLRWGRLTGFVWIDNLANAKYETFGTYAANGKLAGAPVQPFTTPAPPIHVVVGVSYRF